MLNLHGMEYGHPMSIKGKSILLVMVTPDHDDPLSESAQAVDHGTFGRGELDNAPHLICRVGQWVSIGLQHIHNLQDSQKNPTQVP